MNRSKQLSIDAITCHFRGDNCISRPSPRTNSKNSLAHHSNLPPKLSIHAQHTRAASFNQHPTRARAKSAYHHHHREPAKKKKQQQHRTHANNPHAAQIFSRRRARYLNSKALYAKTHTHEKPRKIFPSRGISLVSLVTN